MSNSKSQTSYQQKLRHPKWQKKRLEMLQEAAWKCSVCGNEEMELHIHHLYYEKGREPWDYPNDALLVVCAECHEKRVHTKEELFRDLPDLSHYYVVDYHHIDDFRCMRPLREYFEALFFDIMPSERFIEELEKELRRRLSDFFRGNGWEGDGSIECIFIPPCFYSNSDTYCETVFHVKQSNNGTSFLAIPKYLRFELPEGFLVTRGQ